jgi:hypothetical protein
VRAQPNQAVEWFQKRKGKKEKTNSRMVPKKKKKERKNSTRIEQ